MPTTLHPTAEKLISTVSVMLDGARPHEILVDDVLAESGVARGSLYHHFGDYQGLIEATLLRRFAVNVDADTKAMAHVADSATDKNDYWIRMRTLSALTQLPERAPVRAERARILALASSNERFGQALSVEQDRLTNGMADTITRAQAKGWVNTRLNARAIAVFLQAYSLGRAVDDIASEHVANSDWLQLIEAIITPLESE